MKFQPKMLWDSTKNYCEVWFSPSGFKRDDTISKGFICLTSTKDHDFGRKAGVEFLRELNQNGRHWELSELSIKYTKGWEEVHDLPDFVKPQTNQ